MTDRSMRAFRLAYDGRPFHGFQRQPEVATVEGALFDALRALDLLGADESRPMGYAAAGRTDAGVSARAQTVALRTPGWCTPRALNGELPRSVRAWASAEVSESFHATHDAVSRAYVYHLYAPQSGGPGLEPFDDARARDTLTRLAGEHDFHNLTPDETGTVRDLTVAAHREGDLFRVRLRAGGFARQLARRVVGLVAAVGRGETDPGTVERVLAPEPLEGPMGVAPAPAEGLILSDVDYGGVDFHVDEAAAADTRAVFADRHGTWRTAAAVAGHVRDGVR